METVSAHEHENDPSAHLVWEAHRMGSPTIYSVKAGFVVCLHRGLYLKPTFNTLDDAIQAIDRLAA